VGLPEPEHADSGLHTHRVVDEQLPERPNVQRRLRGDRERGRERDPRGRGGRERRRGRGERREHRQPLLVRQLGRDHRRGGRGLRRRHMERREPRTTLLLELRTTVRPSRIGRERRHDRLRHALSRRGEELLLRLGLLGNLERRADRRRRGRLLRRTMESLRLPDAAAPLVHSKPSQEHGNAAVFRPRGEHRAAAEPSGCLRADGTRVERRDERAARRHGEWNERRVGGLRQRRRSRHLPRPWVRLREQAVPERRGRDVCRRDRWAARGRRQPQWVRLRRLRQRRRPRPLPLQDERGSGRALAERRGRSLHRRLDPALQRSRGRPATTTTTAISISISQTTAKQTGSSGTRAARRSVGFTCSSRAPSRTGTGSARG